VDVVVSGRNVEVPDHFRIHVQDKLSRVERYDPKMIRADVELSHESNRRQSKNRQRIQITVTGRGPTVRAEATAESFYAALEAATDRLDRRMRQLHERRLSRVSSRAPLAVVAAEGGLLTPGAVSASTLDFGAAEDVAFADPAGTGPDEAGDAWSDQATESVDSAHPDAPEWALDDGPGRIVRIKDHPGEPMTVDQALLRMELVGHDFYLFNDAETGKASVVYRRRGFDYGLLRLA
jgi:ribosomal subunit interface protein